MRWNVRVVTSLLPIVVSLSAARAELPTWDHSNVEFGNGINISSFLPADDFVLAEGRLLSGATIWLVDGAENDNGELDSFSGTLSWAIYDGSTGSPGALIVAGQAGNLLLADTGKQAGWAYLDVVQVSFEFTRQVQLAAGTYFLVIHENLWQSDADGSTVYWVAASAIAESGVWVSQSPTAPGSWYEIGVDVAFALYGNPASWGQGDTVAEAGNDVSASVAASDVFFEEPVRVSTLEVWLIESPANDNGVLDGFGGTLSWAIYSDAAGAPGTLLWSGSDASPELSDTGVPANSNSGDLVRARISLGGTYDLDAQTYWIALHEGSWGSPADGTAIYWATAIDEVGASTRLDGDPTDPGAFSTDTGTDTAFTLSENEVFASGFEAGGTCAWSNGASIDCP